MYVTLTTRKIMRVYNNKISLLLFQDHMKSGAHVNFIINSHSLEVFVEDVDFTKVIKKF